MYIHIDPHPLLSLAVIWADWPVPLGEHVSPAWLIASGAPGADTRLTAPGETHKKVVRDLLRHGGFQPAGRSKPSWEYLQRAAEQGRFPSINAAVDANNVASLHGALPISTVDVERLQAPLRIGIAGDEARYIFNASGQEIALGGLLCLFDAQGPCANAVKDAQRVKTDENTTQTLSIVWGTRDLPGRSEAVGQWLAEMFAQLGARTRFEES